MNFVCYQLRNTWSESVEYFFCSFISLNHLECPQLMTRERFDGEVETENVRDMNAGKKNLCRFTSPYGNDANKRTKNTIIITTRALLQFRFLCRIAQTHFYANPFDDKKHPNWELTTKTFLARLLQLSIVRMVAWWRQMHLIKCHFHEIVRFVLANSNERKKTHGNWTRQQRGSERKAFQ